MATLGHGHFSSKKKYVSSVKSKILLKYEYK